MLDSIDTYDIALDVFAGTPASLVALLEPLSAEVWAWSPAPGEWSPQETLAHMLHVETAVIPVRVRQMIAGDGAPLVNPPEETAATSPEATLRAWRDARDANLAFLRGLTPEQLAKTGEHPHYGRMSAREHIVEWAYHDLDHLRQLQATIEAHIYPAIGGFRALYPPPFPAKQSAD